MANPAVYIKNADQSKLSPKDYDIGHQGVILTRYRGTRAKALRLKVPLFYRNGNYVGNLGYPKGQPRPKKGQRLW